MTIQLELWQLLTGIGSVTAFVVTAFWWLASLIIKRSGADLDRRFKEITKHLNSQDTKMQQLQNQLTELRVEVARDYVNRDDHNRDFGSLGTQFQALAINVERLFKENTLETLAMIKAELRTK